MTNIFLFIIIFYSNIIEKIKIQLTFESEHVSAIEPENSISHCNSNIIEKMKIQLSLLKILIGVVRRMLEPHALIANKSEAKEESYLFPT
jgi:hypothetical protein